MSSRDYLFTANSTPRLAFPYLPSASARAPDDQCSPLSESSRSASDSTAAHAKAVQLPAQRPFQKPTSSVGRKKKKNFTREDRAVHSLVERQRRGTFNGLLSQLASSVPNQRPAKNLSKGIIVQASIDYHAKQRQRSLTACVEIRKLLAQRADLLREVNTLRGHLTDHSPRTLDRKEEAEREKDRQDVFSIEVETFYPIGDGRMRESGADRTTNSNEPGAREDPSLQATAAALQLSPGDMPCNEQILQLLESIDDDFYSLAPQLQNLPAGL